MLKKQTKKTTKKKKVSEGTKCKYPQCENNRGSIVKTRKGLINHSPERQLSFGAKVCSLETHCWVKAQLHSSLAGRLWENDFFKNRFIYLFLAAFGLCCCAQAFSSCSERGLLFVAVRGLLIAVASLVAEHRL